MADTLFQDTKSRTRKKAAVERFLWTIFLIIAFFIIGNVQLHSDTGTFATHIKKSFKDYEKYIFQTYSSIEYIDTTEYKKMSNNRCTTHYIKKEYFRLDLKKRRIYSRILDFYLIDGKNEKKRYNGKETEAKLKELYLFSEYSKKKWAQPFIDSDDAYVTFTSSKWFIPLHVTMHYDEQIYFPRKIDVVSDNRDIAITMNYEKFSGIYMLNHLESDVKVDIALIHYHMQTYVTRSDYIFYP